MRYGDEMRKRISKDAKGKTIESMEFEPAGGYWVMKFDGGEELCLRLMAEEALAENDKPPTSYVLPHQELIYPKTMVSLEDGTQIILLSVPPFPGEDKNWAWMNGVTRLLRTTAVIIENQLSKMWDRGNFTLPEPKEFKFRFPEKEGGANVVVTKDGLYACTSRAPENRLVRSWVQDKESADVISLAEARELYRFYGKSCSFEPVEAAQALGGDRVIRMKSASTDN